MSTRTFLRGALVAHAVVVGTLLAREVGRSWKDVRRLGPLSVEARQREVFGPFFELVKECRRRIPADATILYRGRHEEMLAYHLLPRRGFVDSVKAALACHEYWRVELNDYIGFEPASAAITGPDGGGLTGGAR